MPDTISPETSAMPIISGKDVQRQEVIPEPKAHTYEEALKHLSSEQKVRLFGTPENPNIIVFGGDLL